MNFNLILILIASVFATVKLLGSLNQMKTWQLARLSRHKMKTLTPMQQKIVLQQYDSKLAKMEAHRMQLYLRRQILNREIERLANEE